MQLTKETLGEALDCSYASDSGINCVDLNHADLILKAAQRLYDNYDALKALHEQATVERSHSYVGSVIRNLIGDDDA